MTRTSKCFQLAVVVFLCLGLMALAGDPATAKAEKKSPEKTTQKQMPQKAGQKIAKTEHDGHSHGGVGGMVVSIDPATGKPHSTPQLDPEVQQALREMVNQSDEGLSPVSMRDGTVILNLQGRFQSAMVATVGPDGKVQSSCVTSMPKEEATPAAAKKLAKKEKQ